MRSKANHCVYYKQVGENFIYVVFYVDDMLLDGKTMEVMKDVKMQLSSKYDMKDVCNSNLIFGDRDKKNRVDRNILLNRRKYIETILHRFNM